MRVKFFTVPFGIVSLLFLLMDWLKLFEME